MVHVSMIAPNPNKWTLPPSYYQWRPCWGFSLGTIKSKSNFFDKRA